jgi:hypothetical protein
MRLIEGQRNDLMAGKITHISQVDEQIGPGLVLDVDCVVLGVRKRGFAIVDGKGRQ